MNGKLPGPGHSVYSVAVTLGDRGQSSHMGGGSQQTGGLGAGYLRGVLGILKLPGSW